MNYFFLLTCLILFQQAHAQKQEYMIYTKSGETYAAKKYSAQMDNISFKSNGKKHTIVYSQLDKIVSSGKSDKHNYLKKYIYYSDTYGTLMKELVAGKVSLFERVELIPTGGGPTGMSFQNKVSYYVKRIDETVAKNIGINEIFINYKKTSKDFFSDCPELVSKLENKEFKRKELDEVVIFYNDNCGG